MSCPQCFTGHINPGTPTGRWDTVHGLRTYIAEPPAGKSPTGIIVIIPDAFGVDFVNNQILADHYASAADYLVYLPDFMDGKANICFYIVKASQLTTSLAGNAAPVRTMINMAHLWDENESWLSKPSAPPKAENIHHLTDRQLATISLLPCGTLCHICIEIASVFVGQG